MGLLDLVARLSAAVLASLLVAGAICLDRSQLADVRGSVGDRLREVGPHLLLLAGILAVNRVARDVGPELSWVLDLNISAAIYAVEGNFVGTVQSVQRPLLTAYFSGIYLVGYVALLVFPYVAYFLLESLAYLKQTALSYAVNYAVGLLCYLAFVSYGPRNVIPDHVTQPMYATYPQAQVLTGELNANTNVFPSLHTSLALTVALLSIRTRSAYPRWPLLAVPTAASVVAATVYLGIHWALDVVAGALLAVLSVWLADRWT